jgi:alpha-mannosidase
MANNKDKDRANSFLLVYGDGDGGKTLLCFLNIYNLLLGGGATPQMMEFLKRMQKGIDGLPKIHVKKDPLTFYQDLEANARDLITWNGELYFKLHRGTHTSQAANKSQNRLCKFLLHQVEAICSMASIMGVAVYPYDLIDECWKIVLLNQFHDVLPGSSIQQVYKDSLELYRRVVANLLTLQEQTLEKFLVHGAGKDVAFWNTLAWQRPGPYSIGFYRGAIGDSLLSQSVTQFEDDTGLMDKMHLIRNQDLQPHGLAKPLPKTTDLSSFGIKIAKEAGSIVMENSLIKVQVSTETGHVTSYYDKEAKQEVVGKGQQLNVFCMYEDIPLFWDAWDVEIYHLEKSQKVPSAPASVTIAETGPLRVSVKVTFPIGSTSRLTQFVQLDSFSKLVTFDTSIDWHEKHQFLKAKFETEILMESTTFDTQFGVLRRPTHQNTSWDMAKFEIFGHRIVDLLEYGYGVSLFSDSKYGFSVLGGRLCIRYC